jgi:integrase
MSDAIFVSVDRLAKREQMAKAGVQPSSRKRKEHHTVSEIAVTTLARLAKERQVILATEPKKKAAKVAAKITRIKARIVPALGERGISNLTEEDMERFARGYMVDGKAPKKATIGNLNSAWLVILSDAVALGHIKDAHKRRLTISTKGYANGLRGDGFSREEMRAIRTYMSDAWIAAGHHAKVRETRFLLRALVSLMACTGITPGLEVETLTPAQVTEALDSNGRQGLRVAIKGEQGKRKPPRVVWARINDEWPVINDMRALLAWISQNAGDEYHRINRNGYLFARPSDGLFPDFAEVFAKVLDDLRVHTDPVTGVRRRLYSCRHYYATQNLQHGVSPYDVSKNMGSSERMILLHYDHVLFDLRSGGLTGSDQADGAWLRQTGILQETVELIENDPDDHLSEEDQGTANE